MPAKTEYTAGETFDPAGLTLTANYTDTYSDQSTKSSAKDLAYADIQNDLTFTGTDFAEAGTATVTVTYKGKNATFDVTVKEPPAPLTSVTITDIDSYKIPDNFADNGNIHLDLTGEISLLKISDIAKAFPNATITADDKISYTINGGTERDEVPSHIFTYQTLIDNEFKDLTAFKIDGKISIVDSTDDNTHEVGEPTKIRTITVGDNTTLNITGKFLDIGRNRFVRNSDSAIINVSDDIEITTDNSEVMAATRTYITSDIANTQFDALGLTTPNFDLAISDKNLYNFAHDILDRYDGFDDEKHKLKVRNVSFIDGSILGKSLYEENELQSDVPSVKFSSIEYVTTDVSNTKITGDVTSDTTTDINFTNVVFTGDVSGLHNNGTYEGVIHFKDEPMKELKMEKTNNTLIKIDKIPTKDQALITGGIMDFRDVTVDENSDIGTYLEIGEYNNGRGYFKTEAQKNIIEPQIKTLYDGFRCGTYVESIDTELMKTLQQVEETANESRENLVDLFINHPESRDFQSTEPITE